MRIHEVTLQARDPEALAAWYRDALGLPRAPGAPVGVRAGASTLRFEPAPPGEVPPYHLAFNVPEDRIEDALAWIRGRAEVFDTDEGPIVHFEGWDAHALYFADAEGNVLELIARHTLPNASSAPFGPSSILEVSEVGLPCPDVRALAEELEGALDIHAYRPGSERFAPLGDERGLLILVREGRPWFPVGAEARPFPLRIVTDRPPHAPAGLPYRLERA